MRTLILSMMICTVLLSLNGCSCSKEDRDLAKPMTTMEAAGLVQNQLAVLIDVRETAKAKLGTPTQAMQIPEAQIEAEADKLSKAQQIIVVCDDVRCGQRVSAVLAKRGFKASFIPSFEEWKKAGLPVRSNW